MTHRLITAERSFLSTLNSFFLTSVRRISLLINASRKHLSPCRTPTVNATTTSILLRPIQPAHQQLQTTEQATTTKPTPRKTNTNTSRREGTDTRIRTCRVIRRTRIRSMDGIRARLVFCRRSMGLHHRSRRRRRHSRVRHHCIRLPSMGMGMDMGMGMRMER